MLYFDSDYMEGAHPSIIQRISSINLDKNSGYGTDEYCKSAARRIREACGCEKAEVKFLVGGTQTNKIIISSVLKNYEGVIAADSGHISLHEAGAIENSGHKVITLKGNDGKLEATSIESYVRDFYEDVNYEHMVLPGMVYISLPTEYGTLYTKKELKAIHSVCKKFQMKLFIDGARLGYGLMAEASDITLKDIAALADVFYIGGTKVGALFGEAVVIPDPDRIPHLFTMIKQQGGLLAKGWLLGLQFDTLFQDDLYFSIAEHAVKMALRIKDGLVMKGYRLYLDSPTNQQFVIISNRKMDELKRQVSFSFWEKYDETHTVIRFVTSWATKEADVEKLLEIL